jgi:calcineurin-like phosphoesterase
MRTGLPVRFENDPEDCELCGVLLEIDTSLGNTTKISRILLK